MPTHSLFSTSLPPAPLADRLRPQALTEVIGQTHVLGESGIIGHMVTAGQYQSLLLWGPPGCGKTTIARLLAQQSGHHMETISAVSTGVAELKKLFEKARIRQHDGQRTLLFVDEIHRFNRAQQDAFLPVIEDGTILMVGATTENPSFELNSALLSRLQVVILQPLDSAALHTLLTRAEKETGHRLPLTEAARNTLVTLCAGDGRALLNRAEMLFTHTGDLLDEKALMAFIQRRAPMYDKSQEQHYNLISALHKSLRGSDPDAGLYWLARMLDGGEDPHYILRRLTRFAAEDIGLADPQAITQAISCWQAYERIGSPEGELALAQLVIYLATSPKSNAGYSAYKAAMKTARHTSHRPPPNHILNAPTALMKELGYSEGYAYDHNTERGFSGQHYFPDNMERQQFYHPVERGFERDIIKRLEYWARLRSQAAE